LDPNLEQSEGEEDYAVQERDFNQETAVAYQPATKQLHISWNQHYLYLMHSRGSSFLDSYHWLFEHGSLAEYYVIDTFLRGLRHEMEWVRKKQKNLRKTLHPVLLDTLARGLPTGARLGKVIFTPVTSKGSRRYMKKAFGDAMAIFQKHGMPHL
jgi:hypothetical protein